MSRFIWVGMVMVLLAGSAVRGADCCSCESAPQSFFQRFAPAGGWRPYHLPVLHWWPHCCFPCRRAPDDYCRKPLPKVCWPPYPPYYIFGPSAACPGQCNRCQGH